MKDRITRRMKALGMAWAVTSDKTILPNDPFEDQVKGRQTYHVHPDAANPHQSYIKRFDSLKELGSYLDAVEAALAAAERGDFAEAEFIMSEW